MPLALVNVETWSEKFIRKFKENPLVPIGAVATVATLVIASKKMRQGESQKMNHWLRARVAVQGLTILAVCGGAYAMNKKKREAALAEADATGGNTETLGLEKERKEFEERLKDAESVHRFESQSGKNGSLMLSSSSNIPSPPSSTNNAPRGWLGWLGWKSSSQSQPIASNSNGETVKEKDT